MRNVWIWSSCWCPMASTLQPHAVSASSGRATPHDAAHARNVFTHAEPLQLPQAQVACLALQGTGGREAVRPGQGQDMVLYAAAAQPLVHRRCLRCALPAQFMVHRHSHDAAWRCRVAGAPPLVQQQAQRHAVRPARHSHAHRLALQSWRMTGAHKTIAHHWHPLHCRNNVPKLIPRHCSKSVARRRARRSGDAAAERGQHGAQTPTGQHTAARGECRRWWRESALCIPPAPSNDGTRARGSAMKTGENPGSACKRAELRVATCD